MSGFLPWAWYESCTASWENGSPKYWIFTQLQSFRSISIKELLSMYWHSAGKDFSGVTGVITEYCFEPLKFYSNRALGQYWLKGMLLDWTKEIEAGWLRWKKALAPFLTGKIILSPKRTILTRLVDSLFLLVSSRLACLRVALSFDPPQFRQLCFQPHFHSQLPSGGRSIKKINMYLHIQ